MGKKAVILTSACDIILIIVFFELYVFQSVPPITKDPYSGVYFTEFKQTPTPAYQYNFSPPISMYQALVIALQNGGWNATLLANAKINVELDFIAFGRSGGWTLMYRVSSPVTNWSNRQVNDTTYRYVWTIGVYYPDAPSIPSPGYYFVDATTAQLITPVLN